MKVYILFLALLMTCSCSSTAQNLKNTFAIKNVQTGKVLRPYKAGTQDGNNIILYPHFNWKCLTWQLTKVDSVTCQLTNVYTSKAFEPSGEIVAGRSVWQQPSNKAETQYWEFIEQPDKSFLIRLKGTEYYLTISSDKTNSPIILMTDQRSNNQKWILIPQNPKI